MRPMATLIPVPSLTPEEAAEWAYPRNQARCYAVRWRDDEEYRRPLRVVAHSKDEARLHMEDVLGRSDFEVIPL